MEKELGPREKKSGSPEKKTEKVFFHGWGGSNKKEGSWGHRKRVPGLSNEAYGVVAGKKDKL